MEAFAKAKFQRYGRRKVAQILDLIRGKNYRAAEAIVGLSPRTSAVLVRKTLQSAAANLSVKAGKKLDPASVWIKAAHADQGPLKHLKRFNAGPQGRAMPYRRKTCHLMVVVSDTK